MKAIAIDGYGDAGDLQPREAPDPKPGDEEILIRVRASGVNPLDWKIRQGQLRLFLRLRFPYVLGSDIAGEVVSTGILGRGSSWGPGVRLQRSEAWGSLCRTRGREPGCGRPETRLAGLRGDGFAAHCRLHGFAGAARHRSRVPGFKSPRPRRRRWGRAFRGPDRKGAWSHDDGYLLTRERRLCALSRGRLRYRLQPPKHSRR